MAKQNKQPKVGDRCQILQCSGKLSIQYYEEVRLPNVLVCDACHTWYYDNGLIILPNGIVSSIDRLPTYMAWQPPEEFHEKIRSSPHVPSM